MLESFDQLNGTMRNERNNNKNKLNKAKKSIRRNNFKCNASQFVFVCNCLYSLCYVYYRRWVCAYLPFHFETINVQRKRQKLLDAYVIRRYKYTVDDVIALHRKCNANSYVGHCGTLQSTVDGDGWQYYHIYSICIECFDARWIAHIFYFSIYISTINYDFPQFQLECHLDSISSNCLRYFQFGFYRVFEGS